VWRDLYHHRSVCAPNIGFSAGSGFRDLFRAEYYVLGICGLLHFSRPFDARVSFGSFIEDRH
jgi:hypothetical protein